MCHDETISDTNAIQYLIELLYTNDEVINGTYKLELIVVNHHSTGPSIMAGTILPLVENTTVSPKHSGSVIHE